MGGWVDDAPVSVNSEQEEGRVVKRRKGEPIYQ